jgi:hypothetical protein
MMPGRYAPLSPKARRRAREAAIIGALVALVAVYFALSDWLPSSLASTAPSR